MPRKTRQNDITSPELLAQVNPENTRLMNDFLEYLKSVQRSPNTISSYLNDLQIFFVWNLQFNGNKFFPKITKRDYAAYQNWLINTNGNSPARVRRLKSVISSMSNYVENILDDEPAFEGFRSTVKKIENPVNQPVRDKTVLTPEQVSEILDVLVDKKQYEKACMLALAVYSGRRKSELVRFRVCDFGDENLVCSGALYKTKDKIKTKGFGLGKYIYCYTLAKKFKPYFDMWMEDRKSKGIKSEWLFPDHQNPEIHLNASTLNSWAVSIGNIAGVNFYWHCMRHAYVSDLVRAGLPDSVITQIIGWSDVGMCKVYTDLEADEQISMWFDENGEIDLSKRKNINEV